MRADKVRTIRVEIDNLEALTQLSEEEAKAQLATNELALSSVKLSQAAADLNNTLSRGKNIAASYNTEVAYANKLKLEASALEYKLKHATEERWNSQEKLRQSAERLLQDEERLRLMNARRMQTDMQIDLSERRLIQRQNEMQTSLSRTSAGFVLYQARLLAFYAAIGLAAKGMSDLTNAVGQYDYQAARTARVTGPGDSGQIRSLLRTGSQYGANAESSGETFYQLRTFFNSTTEAAKAFDSEMKLITATEGDARTTTRASIQIFEDFREELKNGASDAEGFRRANELLAITFKNSNAELTEISQAVKYLAPIAETAHVKVTQLFGVLSALTSQGIRGRMEGTEAGAFIARIIKAYNDGEKGIVSGNKVYHFDFVRDAKTKGLDLLGTIENIVARYQALRKVNAAAAEEYITHIGGSQQALRLLGSANQDFFKKFRESIADNEKAVKGLTDHVGTMNQVMMKTFNNEAARWWQGLIATASDKVDQIARNMGLINMMQHEGDAFQYGNQRALARATEAHTLNSQNVPDHLQHMGTLVSQMISAAGISGTTGASGQNYILNEDLDKQNITPEDIGAVKALIRQYNIHKQAPADWDAGFYAVDLKAVLSHINSDIIAESKRKKPVATSSSHAGGGLPGFSGPSITDKPGKEPNPDEKSREALDLLNNQRALILAQFEWLDRQLAQGEMTIGQVSGRAKQLATRLNKVSVAIAQNPLAQDPAAMWRMTHGMTPGGEQLKSLEKTGTGRAKEESTDAANRASMFYDYMLKTYGITDGRTLSAAGYAQKAAIKAATAAGDDDQLFKLRNHMEGPLRNYLDSYSSVYDNSKSEAKSGLDAFDALHVNGVSNALDDRLIAIDNSTRPNNIFGNSQQGQRDALLQKQDAYQTAIKQMGTDTFAAADKVKEFQRALDQVNKELRDVNDTMEATKFKLKVEQLDREFETDSRLIDSRRAPRGKGNEQDAMLFELRKLNDQADLATQHLNKIKDLPNYEGKDARIIALQEAEKLAREKIQQFPQEWYEQRYSAVHGQIQGQVTGDFVDMFHGRQSLGGAINGLGNTIVDTAITAFVKKYTDPFISAITGEVLALNGVKAASSENTKALKSLTHTIQGVPDDENVHGSGASKSQFRGGLSGSDNPYRDAAGGHSKGSGGGDGTGKLGHYVGATLGGLSIFQEGQQHGATAGSVIGGAMAGTQIGSTFGPAGAAIGGIAGAGLNLLGGLFHHHHKADTTNKDTNPALFNAPSDFDMMAWNYRTTGMSPMGQQLGINNGNYVNPPVVHVYLSGVEQAVSAHVTSSTSSFRAGQTNTYLDLHRAL